MRRPKNVPNHTCAPPAWRKTPDLTGDYDFDETIYHRNNKDMAAKIGQHISRGKNTSYGPLTAYNGYHGYKGDN